MLPVTKVKLNSLKKIYNCPQNIKNVSNSVKSLKNLGFFVCKSDKLIHSLKSLPYCKTEYFCSVIANQSKLKIL